MPKSITTTWGVSAETVTALAVSCAPSDGTALSTSNSSVVPSAAVGIVTRSCTPAVVPWMSSLCSENTVCSPMDNCG